METKIAKQNNRKSFTRKLAGLLPNHFMKTLFSEKFPVWAYIYMTRKCNENCSYCFYKDDNTPEMSGEELISAIDKAHELGTRYVSFFGGEPTLRRRELINSIKHASLEKRMFTQLPTNGSLLTQDYLDELGEAGLDLLDVSFDSLKGAEGSKKNLICREGLFDKIKNSREKYHYALKINYVVTPHNYAEVDDVFEFAKENDIIVSARLAFAPPLNGQSNTDIYFKNTSEHIKIVEELSKKLIEKKRQGYRTSEPIEFYEKMPEFVKGSKNLWKCDALENNLTIECDGTVRLCGALPCKKGKMEIHFSELNPDYYQRLRKESEALIEKCNDKCMAAAYFCSQFYERHPITFLKNVVLKL